MLGKHYMIFMNLLCMLRFAYGFRKNGSNIGCIHFLGLDFLAQKNIDFLQ